MKKFLLLVFLVLFSSIAFAEEEIECTGSGNTFSGKFPLGDYSDSVDSYCKVSFEKLGFPDLPKSFLVVEVQDGEYRDNDKFDFEVNAALILSEEEFDEEAGHHVFDCRGHEVILGIDIQAPFDETLDMDDDDNFPFIHDCHFNRNLSSTSLISLNISKPETSPFIPPSTPAGAYVTIQFQPIDDLIKKYFAEKFKKALPSHGKQRFAVVIPRGTTTPVIEDGEIINTEMEIYLTSNGMNYANKTVEFELKNKDSSFSFCKITSSFNFDEDASFVRCGDYDVRIVGIEGEQPKTDSGLNTKYYFDVALIKNEDSDGDGTEPDNGTGNGTANGETTASEHFSLVNNLVLEKYYKEIFNLTDSEFNEVIK